MTAAFVNDVTRSIRRSLHSRLRTMAISQDELTHIVSGATRAAVQRAHLSDLAALAAAAAPVIDALPAEDATRIAFEAATAGLSDPVRELLAVTP